jgi:hypothetical protein
LITAMSVSLPLGLVYLISELLLTYSTSSRHGGQAKAGAAPLAQSHRDEAGSWNHSNVPISPNFGDERRLLLHRDGFNLRERLQKNFCNLLDS